MANSDPRHWLDRFIGACFGLLIGGVALAVAVHLLESIWFALLIISMTVIGVIGLIAVIRNRRQGW